MSRFSSAIVISESKPALLLDINTVVSWDFVVISSAGVVEKLVT
jgi:hypothetical protein